MAVNCNGESKPSESIKILIEDYNDDKVPKPSFPPSVDINCSTISKLSRHKVDNFIINLYCSLDKSTVLVLIFLALFIVLFN